MNTYEPAIFPADEIALVNARATARFDDEEREIVLLTHVTDMTYATHVWVIRNLDNISDSQGMGSERRPYKERYLTVVFIVVMAIRNPMIPTRVDIAMWPKRSPAWSECLSYHVSKLSYRDWRSNSP